MSNTIYLYLKTHNVTGLKYLGKTTKDPYQYSGSGVYWKNHLKVYGDDVTTEVLFSTKDENEFERVSLEYSSKWDIVESKDFANLIEERGQGGITTNQWKKGHRPWNKGLTGVQSWTEERKKEQSKRVKEWHKKQGHVLGGKKREPKGWSEESKEISRQWMKGLNEKTITCEYCGKESNVGNHNRWHGERCKHNV